MNCSEMLDMKKSLGVIAMVVLAAGIIASPLSVSAQTYQQVVSTDAGTIKVGINTDPSPPKSGETTKLKIDFLNPQTDSIQEHVDYTVTVTNSGSPVFGPIPLTHTSIGTSTIPVEFKNGDNQVVIEVQGILFRPIPTEKATFSITVGEKQSSTQQKEQPKSSTTETSPQKTKPATSDTNKKAASIKIPKKVDKTNVKKDTKKTSKAVKTPVKKPVKKVTTPVKKTSTPVKKTTTKY